MSKQREDVQHKMIPLRDWFAGQALSGLIARGVPDTLAIRKSYEIADMMLHGPVKRRIEHSLMQPGNP